MLSDTYQLVHSLTKAEKRYFKRSASVHVIGEKNNYLKLFESLSRQKELDESAIRQEFRSQHLYLLKQHLQRSLLKSLRTFHAASSASIRIQTMIGEVDVLSKKGLVKAALKHLYHAKKIALRHEQHLACLHLLEQEIKLLSLPRKFASVHPRISRAFEEAEHQLERYKDFQTCFGFRMSVNAMHNKEIILQASGEKEDQKKYITRINELSSKDLSEKAKWELYNGAGTYYLARGNYAEGNAYLKKAAHISQAKFSLVNDELREYLLSLQAQSTGYFYLKKYDQALDNLKLLSSFFATLSDPENKKGIRELYLYSLLLEGFIHMEQNAYEKAKNLIMLLKQEIGDTRNLQVSLRNDVYYQQAGFWFCTGNFGEARSWVVKMLQDEDAPKENPARYRFARLMQLMVLLELGEFTELENLLPAAKKFLRRKGHHPKMEGAVLDLITQYTRGKEQHSAAYAREKFSELKRTLTRIAKDKNEAVSLRVFDYLAWSKAKIENRTMAEMVK